MNDASGKELAGRHGHFWLHQAISCVWWF